MDEVRPPRLAEFANLFLTGEQTWFNSPSVWPEAREIWGGPVSFKALRWAVDAEEGSKYLASTGSQVNMVKTSLKNCIPSYFGKCDAW